MNRIDRTLSGRYIIVAALILLAVLAWPAAGWSRTAGRACNVGTDVWEALLNWGAMLEESTPKYPIPIVETYEPDNARKAVLLPTCKSGPFVGRDAITEYFRNFLKYEPKVQFTARHIDGDCTIAFASGTYTFTLVDHGDLLARYTYVFKYRARDRKWLIAQHHSSLVLDPPQKCPPEE